MKQIKNADWPPDSWCAQVGRSIDKTSSEVRTMVRDWYTNGKSVDDIRNILTQIAQVKGRKLIFVGTNGNN